VYKRQITFTPQGSAHKSPVLFIAGWVSLIRGWKQVLSEMTKDFVVHYVETREKKTSRIRGKVSYSIEAMSQDIAALVNYFQFKNGHYILFGSSLGATCILDCYRVLQIQPRCLILIEPNGFFRIPWFWLLIVRLLYPPLYIGFKYVVLWYLKHFRMNVKSDRAQYEKYWITLNAADPWKLRKSVLAVSKYEVWPFLETIRVPVLIFGASEDKLHEPDILERIVSAIRQATYYDLKTNTKTHSREVVLFMQKYLSEQSKIKRT